MNEKLKKLNQQLAKSEARLRRAQHEEKILEHQMKQLTRKERTHRLCTRGAMLESFLIRPEVLTDDDVMDILKQAFSQTGIFPNRHERSCCRKCETEGSWGTSYEVRAQLYTGRAGALRPAGSPLQGADDFRRFSICSNHHRGSYTSPALAAASYPFVDLPPRNTLRYKLFPSSKFYQSSYPYLR